MEESEENRGKRLVRKGRFVPMITLGILLTLTACGVQKSDPAAVLRGYYQDMTGCSMEAIIHCDPEGVPWEAKLRCDYTPDGESVIEALSPETIAGVRAVMDEATWYLRFGEKNLDAGTMTPEALSPAHCLPRLMNALRNGWLLEENEETWDGVSCVRLTVDQSGVQTETRKILSTLWLRQDDGTPVRGEIAVDGEIILTAEFTNFLFYDTMPS